ncbi:competence protein CoiA family protein [Streptomyces sp. bgisy082]|uniref:competence protein CoiA family protein n=1 Tax=Streptomyces sp. bgisy082 TaxID=3413776 RepID=UPI003D744E8F
MDRRLIRTAVFDSPDSDEPALCPETVDDLDAFCQEHTGRTIWCGTMFEGGCGRQLTTKRCTDKICHFAHYPSDGSDRQCGRKNQGEDSANHLFAKAHLSSWLRAQGLTAEFSYPEPRGSAVAVHLEDGRVLLVHLDRNQPVTWDPGTWEIILGPGVQAPDLLTQRGYLYRVRFRDRSGAGRTMDFGVQVYGEGSTWDLRDVVLTDEGLASKTKPVTTRTPTAATRETSTPVQREIVTITSRAADDPRKPDPVQQALRRLDIAKGDPGDIRAAVVSIRRLLEADQTPDDAARLHLALRRAEQWLDERAQRRRAVVRQLKERPTENLYRLALELMRETEVPAEEKEVIAAVEASRRRAQEQQRAARQRALKEQREAQEREQAQKHEADRQARAEMRLAAERKLAEDKERLNRQARAEKIGRLFLAVRGALKKAARENRITTWPEIQQKTGLQQLGSLDHADKVELLALVEQDTAAQDPLWSTVLAAAGNGAALRLHRDVCHRLGRPLTSNDWELIEQLAVERDRVRRQ